MKINKSIKIGAISVIAASPAIAVVSCSISEQPIVLKSEAYAYFIGNQEEVINRMLNESLAPGTKQLPITIYGETDGNEYRTVGPAQGYTIDLSDTNGPSVNPITGHNVFTLDDLTNIMNDTNIQINHDVDGEIARQHYTDEDALKFKNRLRVLVTSDNSRQTICIKIVEIPDSTVDADLIDFINNYFFDATKGIKLVDNITPGMGWQFFMGVSFQNFDTLTRRYHLTANYASEQAFNDALNVETILVSGTYINKYATDGGDHDIYIVAEPILEIDKGEFTVRFTFYKGGNPVISNKDYVNNYTSKTVRDVPLPGAFPKSTDEPDYQTNSAAFKTALEKTHAWVNKNKIQLGAFDAASGGVMHSQIQVVKQSLNYFTDAKIQNAQFREDLYHDACQNPLIDINTFLRAGSMIETINPLAAHPLELEMMLSTIVFVYSEAQFIQTHPIPQAQP